MTKGRVAAYLTMDDLSAFVSDASLSVPAMNALGWDVEFVSWRSSSVDWNRFEIVYICTPWDYQDDPDRFLAVLEAIEAASALLVNPLETVRWNLDKTYLRELEQSGIAIVPSCWFDRWDAASVRRLFAKPGSSQLVIKPQVGANAEHTHVLTPETLTDREPELAQVFAQRPFFVQPFIASIQTEGEYSVIYFGGEFSHAILKTPAAGDFRSQEEHGADIQPARAEADLKNAAAAVMDAIKPQPVYARADFVRSDNGEFLLMELELIEPSLYFRTDPDSPQRFARALDRALRSRG